MFNGNPEAYKLALTLISTVRGIPQIYYGSEIGMRGDKPKLGDGDIRRDFPGGWKNDAQNAFNPATQTKEQKEFYDFTQKILNCRKNNDIIHTGKTKHYLPENGVYVYFRYTEKGSVMIVLNNNEKEQTLDLKRFNEIRDVLDRENIKYKYKVKDQLGEWTGSGTLRGRVGSAGNPAEQAKQYEILVDRKNLEQARFAIQK
jgi:glycosidase